MSYTWAKVHIEILDDHKMGMLPDSLWRRVIELILLAKKTDKDGWLPGMIEMSWVLRIPVERLEADLAELSKISIVELKEGNWFLTNFAKRQAAEPVSERVRNFRKRRESHDSNADVTQVVTESYQTRLKTKTRQDKTSSGASAPAEEQAPQDLSFAQTPSGAILGQKLAATFASKNRRPPKGYANGPQRDAFQEVFGKLGQRLPTLLDSAMQADITDRARLLRWLEGCAKKDGRGSNSTGNDKLAQANELTRQRLAEHGESW